MLDWSRPWALLLLPLIPLVLWAWQRRPRAAVAWPGAAELAALASRWPDQLALALRAIALVAVVLALAGLRVEDSGARLDFDGIAIMMVVDVSGSMAEPDAGNSPRLDAVKAAFAEFVQRRTHDRLGLVLFATHPETAAPLTLDHDAIMQSLDAAQPRGLPTESETNLGDALAWGLERMRKEPGRKVIVVCSDGEHNVTAPALTPRQAAQLAAAAGVPIYSIFAGPDAGAGREGLETIARMTEGASFAAGDSISLANAIRAIDAMERQRAYSHRTPKYVDWDGWLALSGVLAIVLIVVSERLLWLRTP